MIVQRYQGGVGVESESSDHNIANVDNDSQ